MDAPWVSDVVLALRVDGAKTGVLVTFVPSVGAIRFGDATEEVSLATVTSLVVEKGGGTFFSCIPTRLASVPQTPGRAIARDGVLGRACHVARRAQAARVM